MNSAIEDAHNLAWKLALRVRGQAGDALLDTYSAERVQAARENLAYASKGAEFMSPPSKPHRLMRDAVLSLSARHPAITSLMSPRQHAANDYVGSPLNGPSASEGGFAAGPRPGMVLPECPLHLKLASGERAGFLTELLGPCFTVLLYTAQPVQDGLGEAVQALAQRVPLRLCAITPPGRAGQVPGAAAEDTEGRLALLYDLGPGDAYLVRPDGHVMSRWRAVKGADLDAALALIGNPAAPTCASPFPAAKAST